MLALQAICHSRGLLTVPSQRSSLFAWKLPICLERCQTDGAATLLSRSCRTSWSRPQASQVTRLATVIKQSSSLLLNTCIYNRSYCIQRNTESATVYSKCIHMQAAVELCSVILYLAMATHQQLCTANLWDWRLPGPGFPKGTESRLATGS